MHIEQFIGSNPLLASTSCTDPVNNLKNLPKQTHSKTPQIVLSLTETNQQPTRIRSRSPSPFWIKGQTSTYSEVVKTGSVLRNNSKNTSPEPRQVEGRISRKSNFTLLETPMLRSRSKSPKDKWQQKDSEKYTTLSNPLYPTISPSNEPSVSVKELKDNLNITLTNTNQVKRRSRSRRNRCAKKDSKDESVTNKDVIETITCENVILNQNINTNLSIKPDIIVSGVKNQQESGENLNLQSTQRSTSIVLGTCNQQTDELKDDSRITSNNTFLIADTPTASLNVTDNFSKSRLLSLTNVSDAEYLNSCFDLNERLKGIFGSVDKKHYRNRAFDRPRSKSDTRDLNELSQIFTSPNINNNHTCCFERSAESVKNNFNRDSTSGRHSFDNILSPFGKTQLDRSNGNDNEHGESVRLFANRF